MSKLRPVFVSALVLVLAFSLVSCSSLPSRKGAPQTYLAVVVAQPKALDGKAVPPTDLRLLVDQAKNEVPLRVGLNFVPLPSDGRPMTIFTFFGKRPSPKVIDVYFSLLLQTRVLPPAEGTIVVYPFELSFEKSTIGTGHRFVGTSAPLDKSRLDALIASLDKENKDDHWAFEPAALEKTGE